MRVLLYGAKGWIAGYFIPVLESKGHHVIPARARADDAEAVAKELSETQPTHVLSMIGCTHGDGINTIDYLEMPGKLQKNLQDNLYAPVILAMECHKMDVHFTYLGTGCIFNASAGERAYREDDVPDFFGSSYSIVKGFTDRLMHNLQGKVLNVRIRMPITADFSSRNFITKIATYPKVCSNANSMSVLPTLLPYLASLMEMCHQGTINFTNPGTISHNEILEMYREIVDPNFFWENFTEEEQNQTLLSKRSTNKLDTKALELLFPDIENIHVAVKKCLQCMICNQ